MTMITIRQLRYFEALAETLHFGRAPSRLNISQPALSAQIAQMETDFGTALFERPAERRLADAGRPDGWRGGCAGSWPKCATSKRSPRPATNCSSASSGSASSPLLAPYLLPGLLAELAQSFPRLAVGVRENVTAQLADELARGELDCVVQALPVERKGVGRSRSARTRSFWPCRKPARPALAVPVRARTGGGRAADLLEEGIACAIRRSTSAGSPNRGISRASARRASTR